MTSFRPHKDAVVVDEGSAYPYTVHRIYLCGHPDEYIRVDQAPDTTPILILHTIVPRPEMIEGRTVKPYRQMRQRCASCAETHRASARQPRSLAAHQIQKQGDPNGCKDGFMHVLRRERFLVQNHNRIRWPDEREDNPGFSEYCYLKDLHDKNKLEGDVHIHAAISWRGRAGRRIYQGPERVGTGKLVYVVQTAIDSSLARGLDHADFDADELATMQRQTHSVRLPSENKQVCSNTNPPEQEENETGLETNQQPKKLAHFPLRTTSEQITQVLPPRVSSESQRQVKPPGPGPMRTATLPKTQTDVGRAEEIARNRALALQLLEGRTLTSTERHSDSIPLTSQHQLSRTDMCLQENVPSYVSHQRPFGPTRPSGGTTLSYGDQPRHYDGRPPDRSEEGGVSISSIMETLFPPEHSDDEQNKGEE